MSDYDFVGRLPFSPARVSDPRQLQIVRMAQLRGAESLTGNDLQIYFRNGDVHYLVRDYTPNMDDEIIEKTGAAEAYFGLLHGLTTGQRRIANRTPSSVSAVLLRRDSREIDLISLGFYRADYPGEMPFDDIFGSRYSFGEHGDSMLFDADNNLTLDFDDLFSCITYEGPLEQPERIVELDLMPNLLVAVEVIKAREAEAPQ